MTPTSDIDDKIRALLDQLDRATPAPPSFEELHRSGGPERSRLVPLVGAAAIVAVGVGGVIAGSSRDRSPVSQPPALTSEPQPDIAAPSTSGVAPVQSPTRSLLSTELDSSAAPFIVVDQPDWQLANAFGETGLPISGGFEGSTVFVGEGPTYDAPLFAATVVASTTSGQQTQETVDSIDTLVALGEPIDVAGTTGAITVIDSDGVTGLTGPIVTLFWPLPDGHVARVNAVRLSPNDVISIANELTIIDGDLTMPVPDGYRQLDTPTTGERRYFSYRFTHGDSELEVIGENRGVASLLGRIAGEVRTTRVIDDAEIAYRAQPDSPTARASTGSIGRPATGRTTSSPTTSPARTSSSQRCQRSLSPTPPPSNRPARASAS